MAENNVQKNFVELLKNAVPGHISLAEEVSQVLKISQDSAYRRLRGETELTLNETILLCEHFDIPLEALTAAAPNVVNFRFHNLSAGIDSFTRYLDELSNDTAWLSRFQNPMILYAAEDLPMLYHMYYPALSRFKMCYWNKSIMNLPELQGKKVEEIQFPSEWREMATRIADRFLEISSTEIWNADTIKGNLQQIQFYWEAGFFEKKETVVAVLKELHNLVSMVNRQAEVGKKMNPIKQQFCNSDYILYITDLRIGNNFVFLEAEDKEASYLVYNTFNYMRTTNQFFNQQAKNWLHNLIAKSTLVTKVAEKQRNQFFKGVLQQIVGLIDQIEKDNY